MNIELLREDVQAFIRAHERSDIPSLMLRGIDLPGVSAVELAGQIESRRKLAPKAPVFTATNNTYMPPKLAVEQATSQLLAEYKAQLVQGQSFIDLTGGMGVDSYFLSQQLPQGTYCEQNEELAQITAHNFQQLGAAIKVITGNGMDYLQECDTEFDVVYVDPARRGGRGQKVFLLEDCQPNILLYWDLLLQKGKVVMIKLSPIIDIHYLINTLPGICDVCVVAEKNEVKEVLLFAFAGNKKVPNIHAVILAEHQSPKSFTYAWDQEKPRPIIQALEPSATLYIPAAPVLKAQAHDHIAEAFKLHKLHPNSHLYWKADTSTQPIADYLGKVLKLKAVVKIDKKELHRVMPQKKANIICKNFPLKPAEIAKKFGFKEGGDHFLIATTIEGIGKRFLIAEKIL
ncbi:MAG: RsmD family RNA methyltransferase [Saprospiraceae bacterium]|nr:RsmD family RNA methyltransferase [Saprospiraceae bacterium]